MKGFVSRDLSDFIYYYLKLNTMFDEQFNNTMFKQKDKV